MLTRLATAVALLALCAISIVRVGRAPSPVAATAPDTVFSAERAMHHVEAIAARPHAVGMPDHARVRDYLMGQLTSLGLRAQVQRTTAIGTRYQEAGRIENVLAWVPGSSPNGKAVLLMVHYDGVEAGPAAADDGAGSAALLETLRALRARKAPLKHDIIALFTDGEETGLLGAAAFVREHPWAKDVAIALNFEARGTTGRSLMFETGPGNLDAARGLRTAGDVTAGSVFTAVYRVLPNDTDLSEFSVLGVPALNFAFADGVERYHTSNDDVAHLNPGSVQHHGAQMLALAKTFANEDLPRPVTGDAVFFDLPIVGLIVYPVALELPLAILGLVLVGMLAWRVKRGIVVGAVAALLGIALAACVAMLIGKMLSGPQRWSGAYASTIALLAVAVTIAVRRALSRWSSPAGMLAGTLVVGGLLALVVSVLSPGVSYLFAWPVLLVAVGAVAKRAQTALAWLGAAMTILLLAGFAYGTSVIMLGVFGAGAIALGALTAIVALFAAPQIDVALGDGPFAAAVPAALAVVAFVYGAITVKPSAEHPIRTSLTYTENADSTDAWLGIGGVAVDAWTRSAIEPMTIGPNWAARIDQRVVRFTGKRVARVALDMPNATLARDTVINGARRVVLRVTAPSGTTGLVMRAPGAHVLTASIDGRIVDTTRFRYHSAVWVMEYSAVSDSGAVVALSIPIGASLHFELAARRPGLPVIPGMTIPPRPAFVVESQSGDATVVYRRFSF